MEGSGSRVRILDCLFPRQVVVQEHRAHGTRDGGHLHASLEAAIQELFLAGKFRTVERVLLVRVIRAIDCRRDGVDAANRSRRCRDCRRRRRQRLGRYRNRLRRNGECLRRHRDSLGRCRDNRRRCRSRFGAGRIVITAGNKGKSGSEGEQILDVHKKPLFL